MIKVIEDLGYIPPPLSLYSGTRQVEVRHLGATVSHNGIKYMINLIDTPGFHDKVQNGGTAISNNEIKRLLDKCISHEITQIHLFAFAFSLDNGINSEDVDSMKFVKQNYPHLNKHFALILTHCEDLDEATRTKLVTDFFDVDEIKRSRLQEFFGLGVHFMGTIDPQAVAHALSDTVANQMRNVIYLRETFIDFILAQSQFYNIHNTAGSSCVLS